MVKRRGILAQLLYHGLLEGCEHLGYLEVPCTYNLLSNCSYNSSTSRVTVVMGFMLGL